MNLKRIRELVKTDLMSIDQFTDDEIEDFIEILEMEEDDMEHIDD